MDRGDKPIKSVYKTISWRIVASITTVILVYIFTGEIKLAFSVGVIEVIVKMILYYLHERAWNKV